jgi:hypothetical protein
VIDHAAIRAWSIANKKARDEYRARPFERPHDNAAAGYRASSKAAIQAAYRERKKEGK